MIRYAVRALRLAPLALALVATAGCGDDPQPRPPADSGTAYAEPREDDAAETPTADAPRSVILLVGDGMGPQQMGLLMDWAQAAGSETTNLQRLANAGTLGMLRTGAFDTPYTDSAASGTALACGIQARNGAIAVDPKGKPAKTCLEDARDSGRRTGLVTTTRLTHATPACFASHVVSRRMEPQIAAQFVREADVDVLLGGGARFFPEPLLEEATAKGYRLLHTQADLDDVPADATKLLGLFARSHLPFLLDRDAPGEATAPTLAALTRTAVDVLGRGEKGFFLMVEGGRIDHAGHANDVAGVLGEMREFDAAVGVALAYQKEHPDVLVVVTADHETGGLAVTSGKRVLLPRDFVAMAEAEDSIGAAINKAGTVPKVDPAVLGRSRLAFYPPGTEVGNALALDRSATWNVSFGTQGHTTTPVAVLAVGPGHAHFGGIHRNGRVGRLLREWMQR